MAFYNDGTTFNSGARYAGEMFQRKHMSRIKINVSNSTVPQKLAKGAEIIAMSTANPNVPGNTAALAAFNTAQTGLQAAKVAAEEARNTSKECTQIQKEKEAAWMTAITTLAAVTQSETGGDAGEILSTGFDVCNPATPTVPLTTVTGVTVALNGEPGHSKLSWNGQADADGYIIEGSPDPITATSWQSAGVSTRATFAANGAAPGQKYWYRVAGFNALGRGPWSQATSRPLM